jgi:salicylate biosynthesis isochorismate synthase/menaquinone-specific isochorismate synthase
VPLTRASSPSPFVLDAASRTLLEERCERALGLARGQGRGALAAVTVPLPAETDFSAAVLAARRPDDRFFCLEQPDRGGFALATLGAARLFEARGPSRFAEVARAARAATEDAICGEVEGPPGSGPVLVGGFAFAHEGGAAPEWSSLAPAQLVLPQVALARQDGVARLTVCAWAEPDDDRDALLGGVERRLAELVPAGMPLLDPDPVTPARVASAAPPEHYEAAVAAAVDRIARGELEKIVLAREVRVHAPGSIDPAPVLDGLRSAFPACYCYCAGTPEAAFVGASPELLVRRDGARAQTVALAGTTRRSADPAVDRHLGEQLLQSAKNRGEQAIVARRIERTLRPVSVWVAAARDPVIVKVQNVQHLATPIRAQLAEPIPCAELAGLLHPTPAVGGEPRGRALPLIPALEGLDRGWYAGAVGWTDLAEDGEFCVALRCALLRGRTAHLYTGCGIVADSVPADELAESEVKLEALLPLLA